MEPPVRERLLAYLQHTARVTPRKIRSHTEDPLRGTYPQRHVFVLLKSLARRFFRMGLLPRVVALSGLRGTGKTVLLWQTLEYIYRNHTHRVWAVEGDMLQAIGATLLDVMEVLETKVVGKPLWEIPDRMVLMVDEVHFVDQWARDLKIIHDRYPQLFTLVGGSSALHLATSVDLAARWTRIHVFPLKFTEFLMLDQWYQGKSLYPPKGLADKLRSSLFYAENFSELIRGISRAEEDVRVWLDKVREETGSSLWELAQRYMMFHNLPRFLLFSPPQLRETVMDLIWRTTAEDVSRWTGESPAILMQLLVTLVDGDAFHLDNLSREMGLSRDRVEKAVDAYERAEMLGILRPYGGARRKRSFRKAIFLSPTFRWALHTLVYGERSDRLQALVLEDLTGMTLMRVVGKDLVSFPDGKAQVKPDFVVETGNHPVLIEVGTGKKSARQILGYIRKTGMSYRYGLVISPKFHIPDRDEKHRILFLPLSWFLLL